MADPIDYESLNEWIELYNNDSYSINLSGWIIGDNSDNDTLQGGLYGGAGTILRSGSYAVITDDLTRVYDNFNVSSNALRIYVDDSSIGNGLINSGETIFLYDKNKTLIHSVYYNSTSEGLSWSFFNDIWLKTNSTPGYDNNGSLPVQQMNNKQNRKKSVFPHKSPQPACDYVRLWSIRGNPG